jgi:hypothetical protein
MRLAPRGLNVRVTNASKTLAGVLPLYSRACCFNGYWMFSERKMGTPARLMALKSVKSDQPNIKATSPRASGLYWLLSKSRIPKRSGLVSLRLLNQGYLQVAALAIKSNTSKNLPDTAIHLFNH